MTQTKLGAYCEKVIEAGWLAAIVVVPLFFNVYSSRVFEPDKITLLRSIAVVMVVAWLIKTLEHGFRTLILTPGEGEEGARAGVWQQLSGTPLVLPTLALIAVYLLSSFTSVVPRTSFLGSYQRLQGTYSTLSYMVVFFLMLEGVRRRAQVERIVTAVVLTSVPIALYGILQHYGLDPLPWGGDVRSRVAANMGNAIFIAAYLIMALPLTLYRTVESFTVILSAEESRPVDIVLGAVYIFILALQGITIFFSQSRGPWLGLVGGLFFFFLVLAVVRRWRWLVWAAVAAVLAFSLFLVVFNLPTSPLESLRTMPYVGRLGRVLDKEESTSKVRLLIWQGAIEMISPHPPLQEYDGTPDPWNWARPAIGYGPESMYVAYNRFYPPDLAHYERRNASPDRSHNETFDSLVITGAIGFAVYMWLFASVFYYGFRWLGVISTRGQRNLFLACWFVGGILVATVMGLWQGPEFVGVGLPVGIAAGLGAYLVVWGLFLSRRAEAQSASAQASGPYTLLLVALVSAVIAHFVEIHFGIAIAATRTYFWAYIGLLVVVGYLLPRMASEQPGEGGQSQAPPLRTPRSPSRSRRDRRRRRRPEPRQQPRRSPAGLMAVIPYALVLALILSTLAYDFVSNQTQLRSAGQILWTSLTRRTVRGESIPSFGVLGLLGITSVLGSAVIVGEWQRRHALQEDRSGWLGLFVVCLGLSLAVALLFAMVLAGRWARMVQQVQLLEAARKTLGMLTSYYVLAFATIVLLALALFVKANAEQRPAHPQAFMRPATFWAYPLLLAAVALIIIHTNLRVIHADMVYKQAEPYESQGMWDYSIVLRQESIKLAPQEDLYYLFLGRAFLEKAKTASVDEQSPQVFTLAQALHLTPQQVAGLSRDELLRLSELVLKRAREINPLNTDHSANLGRLYRTQAELASDPAEQQAYFKLALEAYEQATSLSPNAAHLFDEWGLVYFVMGDYQAALAKYEYSLTIDQEYVNTYLSLGDTYMALNDLAQAKEAYLKAVEIDPNVAEVRSVLAYLYGNEGRTEEAISETLRVIELSRSQSLLYNSYKNLALLYRDRGEVEKAMRAAEEALARAPENERANIEGLVAQLRAAGAGSQVESLIQQALADGQAAINSQDWGSAQAAYERALALNPDEFAAHSGLAYVYAQQGRLEEAEVENQVVLALKPGDYATLKNLAIIYRQLGRYDESLRYARQALESPEAIPEEQGDLGAFIAEVEGLK